MLKRHTELHRLDNIGWLRAAVLGANDGIVSTSSLILGVAAAQATHQSILVAGVAGLVAGAMSMATELREDPTGEHRELAQIYIARGLEPSLAEQVATSLMAHDAFAAHSKDELGLTGAMSARPLQAAMVSAFSFAIGAALPLLVVVLAPHEMLIPITLVTSLLFLAFLGGLAAKVGGASVKKGVIRVAFWSALSMAAAAGIGAMFGTVV